MWYVIAVALLYGPYNANVREVIDAETIKFDVAVWPNEQKLIEIGVLGVDSPSLTGECEAERVMAKEAAEMTRVFIGVQARLTDVQQLKESGKFYATVRNHKGESLHDRLIETGYGVPYVKGETTRWCP